MADLTEDVLNLVRAERDAQEARYGETNGQLKSGTGPRTRWLLPYTSHNAVRIQEHLREDYEDFEEDAGLPTWLHLVREEIAEVFELDEDDPNFITELVQVAALCVSWAERRLAAQK